MLEMRITNNNWSVRFQAGCSYIHLFMDNVNRDVRKGTAVEWGMIG